LAEFDFAFSSSRNNLISVNLSGLDWAVLLAAVTITWIIGRARRSRTNLQGLFFANASLPNATVGATNVGTNLAFTGIFLILSEQAYLRGIWVLSVPFCWIIGTIVLYRLYPRIKRYTAESKTLHQALGEAFGSADVRRLASLWTIAGFVGTVALEFYGGIRLLQWTGIPFLGVMPLALLLAFVIGAFTASVGLRGVASADIFLVPLTLASVVILAWMVGQICKFSSIAEAAGTTLAGPSTADNVMFAVGMVVIFVPFQICILDSWQRFASWKRARENRRPHWLLWTGFGLAVLFTLPVLVGIAVKTTNLPVPIDGHPFLSLLQGVPLPVGVRGLLFAGLFAAMFSTADELLNCCSLSFLTDTLQITKDPEEEPTVVSQKLALSGQYYIGIFAVAAATLALLAIKYDRKISEIAVAVFSGQILFTIPVLVALFATKNARRYGRAVKASLLAGFATVLLCVGASWISDNHILADSAPLAGFFVSALSFAVVSRFAGRPG
jgi:Na+/proline symporter